MDKDIYKKILKKISYRPVPFNEGFNLKENQYDQEAYNNNADDKPTIDNAEQHKKATQENNNNETNNNRTVKTRRRPIRKINNKNNSGDIKPDSDDDSIKKSLEENRKIVEKIYGLPVNKDIVLREFILGTSPPVKAFMLFIDGLTDRITQIKLLQDLMILSKLSETETKKSAEHIIKALLPGSQTEVIDTFEKAIAAVNIGDTVFFFEGISSALVIETKGWEHRTVSSAVNEQTITGPKEAFVESLRSNTGLIRKIIRSEKLYTEFIHLGTRIKNEVAIMYISDLANPSLVKEVKRRISSIKNDMVIDIGVLEQYIEDKPFNLNPQTIMTEKPDRVAASLAQGRVAILLSGSPFALLVPVTFYSQMHTGEETYLRWQYGTFIRYVRVFSLCVALLLPGLYIAVVLYHQEMIPTELLLAIAENKEKVPFPTIVELLVMEFSFELIREAGLRIPGAIGSTIGIVGALILGQAAVEANIVSPILVILVAVTGLASFSIPNFQLSFAIRIYRFMYIILGSILGIFGITIGMFLQILLTVSLKSFGTPYTSPSGPRTFAGGDLLHRLPIFKLRRRPDYLNPLDDVRQPQEPRGWVGDKEDNNGKQS